VLGCTILFALMSLWGVGALAVGHRSVLCLRTEVSLFAALFILSLLTRALRSRSH